jgi:glycosyltransferase involved in cell wall biosynthesis
MEIKPPSKVLITGGHELGGVGSVAAGLADGFHELGICAEVLAPRKLAGRGQELRDPSVLKILSTTGVFASPFVNRAICIAHGLPCADVQGWARMSSIIGSFKVANASGAQLVAVSEYTAVHLSNLYKVRIDAVIRNPLKPLFLDTFESRDEQRCYITYLGRLHRAKNLHRLLPAISDVLAERPELCVCIIGEGPLRSEVEKLTQSNPRVEFKGTPDDETVRGLLRKTKVFVSANCTEGLGVTYLEALSQGCVVAMPASGGGLELALDGIGSSLQLFPISLERDQITAVLRKAISSNRGPLSFSGYQPKAVAAAYLSLDSRRYEKARQFVGDRTSELSMQDIASTQ